MKYERVVVTRRGPPHVLATVECDLRMLRAGEVPVRVLATPVCSPDVTARYGRTPFAPIPPFVPGYAVIGDVDAVGEGVTNAAAWARSIVDGMA